MLARHDNCALQPADVRVKETWPRRAHGPGRKAARVGQATHDAPCQRHIVQAMSRNPWPFAWRQRTSS